MVHAAGTSMMYVTLQVVTTHVGHTATNIRTTENRTHRVRYHHNYNCCRVFVPHTRRKEGGCMLYAVCCCTMFHCRREGVGRYSREGFHYRGSRPAANKKPAHLSSLFRRTLLEALRSNCRPVNSAMRPKRCRCTPRHRVPASTE